MPRPPSTPRSPDSFLLALLCTGIAASVLVLSIDAYESGLLKLPLLILFSTLACSLLIAAALRTGAVGLPPLAPAAPVLLLFAVALTGMLAASSPDHARRAVQLLGAGTLCFLGGGALLRGRRELRILTAFLIALSAVVVTAGIAQYLFAEQLGVEFFLGPERRVGSTLGNPSFLGTLLVLLLPLPVALAFTPGRSLGARMLAGTLGGAGIVLVFLTQSRSAMAGLLLAFGVLLVSLWPELPVRARRAVPVLAAALMLALLLSPGARHRLAGAFDVDPGSTFARRLYFWEAGWRAVTDAPVLGHGAGSYERVMIRYRSPDYWVVKSEDVVPHAHNELLEIAVEFGVVGILLATATAVLVAAAGVRALRERRGFERLVAAAFFAGLAGVLFDSMTTVSLRQAPVAGTFWLLAGALVSPALGGGTPLVRRWTARFPAWTPALPLIGWMAFAVPYGTRWTTERAADGHIMRGMMEMGSGRFEQAVQEFRSAELLSASTQLASSSLSILSLRLNRPADALLQARQTRERYPDYPRTWLVEGIALHALGRDREALAAIDRELQLRTHPEAWHARAAICRTLGDTAGERTSLIHVIRQSIRGGPTGHIDQALARLATLAVTSDDRRALQALCSEVLLRLPDMLEARRLLTLLPAPEE